MSDGTNKAITYLLTYLLNDFASCFASSNKKIIQISTNNHKLSVACSDDFRPSPASNLFGPWPRGYMATTSSWWALQPRTPPPPPGDRGGGGGGAGPSLRHCELYIVFVLQRTFSKTFSKTFNFLQNSPTTTQNSNISPRVIRSRSQKGGCCQ